MISPDRARAVAEGIEATLIAEQRLVSLDIRHLVRRMVADPRIDADALLLLGDALRELAATFRTATLPQHAEGADRLAGLVAEAAPERA